MSSWRRRHWNTRQSSSLSLRFEIPRKRQATLSRTEKEVRSLACGDCTDSHPRIRGRCACPNKAVLDLIIEVAPVVEARLSPFFKPGFRQVR